MKINLVRFANGGITFEYLDSVSIPEIFEMYEVAATISRREEDQIKRK